MAAGFFRAEEGLLVGKDVCVKPADAHSVSWMAILVEETVPFRQLYLLAL